MATTKATLPSVIILENGYRFAPGPACMNSTEGMINSFVRSSNTTIRENAHKHGKDAIRNWAIEILEGLTFNETRCDITDEGRLFPSIANQIVMAIHAAFGNVQYGTVDYAAHSIAVDAAYMSHFIQMAIKQGGVANWNYAMADHQDVVSRAVVLVTMVD